MPFCFQTFFDEPTFTATHVVHDPETKSAAIVDSVMDFDQAAGRTSFESAQKLVDYVRSEELRVEWLLETHAHADHLSAAPWLKEKLGGEIAIGEQIRTVQRVFGKVFNEGTGFARDGSQFDRLFFDGDPFTLGSIPAIALHVPGHTPADMAYIIGDAVTSPASYSYSLLNVYAHDNALDGVHVGAAMREGQWTNVRGFANGRDGLWLDVSQAQINGVYAYGNTRNGIWIRNTFSSSYWNMEADKNGNYGIKVTGAVNCNGGNWQAHDNGQHTAGLADVWFDQTNTYSYGITNQTQIFGIEAGPVASGSPWIEGNEPATPTEAYGLNVDPGITGDVAILNVHIPNGGLSGAISVANAGSTGNLLLTDKPGGTANFRVLRGAMKMLAGGIYPSNGAGAAGAGIWSGSGAPTGVTGAASGDVYFRTDTPGTANQRIYIYNGSTWTGIL